MGKKKFTCECNDKDCKSSLVYMAKTTYDSLKKRYTKNCKIVINGHEKHLSPKWTRALRCLDNSVYVLD